LEVGLFFGALLKRGPKGLFGETLQSILTKSPLGHFRSGPFWEIHTFKGFFTGEDLRGPPGGPKGYGGFTMRGGQL